MRHVRRGLVVTTRAATGHGHEPEAMSRTQRGRLARVVIRCTCTQCYEVLMIGISLFMEPGMTPV